MTAAAQAQTPAPPPAAPPPAASPPPAAPLPAEPAPAPPPPAAPAGDQPAAPAPPPAAPETPSTLHGVVTGKDGTPQAGASVSVPSTGALVFTDEKGQYSLPATSGSYMVRVEAVGSLPLEKTVTVGGDPTALDFQLAEDKLGEVITIVGSRTPRSRLETPVPVDIIDNDVIRDASQTEVNQILNVVAPSFNATHQSITDGTDHIDPADLRGLGPEHVLVLINGKRLHQSSLINVYNGGTVGVDLNAIPTSAISRIEVLRDGAASQYGSDAIAGVINIVLKDNVNQVDAYTMTGVTGSGDGAQFKLGANTGFRIADRGFVNVTGEFFARGKTNRSDPWTGDIFPGVTGTEATDAELAQRHLSRSDFTMHVGDAGALVGTAFLNAGYKLDDTFDIHAQGGYTIRKGYASGFYRLPSKDQQVDLNIYPDGFLPEINPLLNAWDATIGLHGKRGPLDGDLSVTYGGDMFHFFVDHSLNASLGDASPTNFDAGKLAYNQTSVNLDGTYQIEQHFIKSLAAVAGAEIRREEYRITAGQPESYEAGPVKTANGVAKVPGSQVFPGFSPNDASDNTRVSEAVYAGFESQPTAGSNLDLGGRYEHYSDFGSTLTGKLAGRLAVYKNDDVDVALRGSASTGFRAPGLQQMWYSTIATQFLPDPNTGMPAPSNILISANRSKVTEAFGAPPLKQETSVNFSGGTTARLFNNLSLSVDYYHVKINDRVVLSSTFKTSDPVLGDEITTILQPFAGVSATQFFVNAVDTTTNGVDVILDYNVRLPVGSLKTTAAANFTSTVVDAVHVPDSMLERFANVPGGAEQVSQLFLGRYGRNRLEDLLPHQKGTLALRWDYDAWSAGVRGNYFGPTKFRNDEAVDGEILDESFGAKVTVDLDVGYRFSNGLGLSIGANNVFNTFPDEVQRPDNRDNGSFLYSPAGYTAGAPYGIDGGFYYVRAEYHH